MRIAIASDHAAVALKADLVAWLNELGHEVNDLGPAPVGVDVQRHLDAPGLLPDSFQPPHSRANTFDRHRKRDHKTNWLPRTQGVELRSVEVGIGEVRHLDRCAGQVSTGEVGSGKVGAGQVRVGQVRSHETRIGQDGPAEG